LVLVLLSIFGFGYHEKKIDKRKKNPFSYLTPIEVMVNPFFQQFTGGNSGVLSGIHIN
jgi:hypothetical protein